jgi:hypothetical protein
MAPYDTRSPSSRRLTCIAGNWAGGCGMRRLRTSRTSARMCFSPTSSRSAISATETPRFKSSMIRLSRLAFAWRAALPIGLEELRAERFRRYPTFGLLLPWRQGNKDISEFSQENVELSLPALGLCGLDRVRSCWVAPAPNETRGLLCRFWKRSTGRRFRRNCSATLNEVERVLI